MVFRLVLDQRVTLVKLFANGGESLICSIHLALFVCSKLI